MVKPQSPGPVYMLPSTVGYNKHDPSRYRNPQYTMRPKVNPPGNRSQMPGPQYQIRNMTEHGKLSPAAYSIKSRPKPLTMFNPPGPGAYSPEKLKCVTENCPPTYTMRPRFPGGFKTIGPGPAYQLPSMIGPKVPNKPAANAFTMSSRHKPLQSFQTPSPAQYQGVNTNVYKNKLPHYTMAGRLDGRMREKSPGPAAYIPKKLCGEKGLMYSMRYKPTDIHIPYITPQDHAPCID